MNSLFATLLHLVTLVYIAVDQAAITQCHSLNHEIVNLGCQMNYYDYKKLFSYRLSEGSRCPFCSIGICQDGFCVIGKHGHIDIEITSASLTANANAYASVCFANSTTLPNLPITDRSKCLSCVTSQAPYGSYPVWNAVCAGSGKYTFSVDSRVTIEVWDHHDTSSNEFLGGITLTIPELILNGTNNRAIHLEMSGGKMNGQINTVITWTRIGEKKNCLNRTFRKT